MLRVWGFRALGLRDVEGFRGLGFRVLWRPRGLSKWVISRVKSTLNGVTLL